MAPTIDKALAHLGDVERADHRAHAEGAEHDAIGLRAAMQKIARDQRHQRRYRTADQAGHECACQHDLDRGRVGNVTHARDDGAVETLARQSRRLAGAAP
jgi:hypothetical protein